MEKDAEGKPIPDDKATAENGFVMGTETTGWAPKFGWPSGDVQEGASMLDHATWLEGRLPDKLYGGKFGARLNPTR